MSSLGELWVALSTSRRIFQEKITRIKYENVVLIIFSVLNFCLWRQKQVRIYGWLHGWKHK